MEEYFQTFSQVEVAWKNVRKHSLMSSDWIISSLELKYIRKQAKQKIKNISTHLLLHT